MTARKSKLRCPTFSPAGNPLRRRVTHGGKKDAGSRVHPDISYRIVLTALGPPSADRPGLTVLLAAGFPVGVSERRYQTPVNAAMRLKAVQLGQNLFANQFGLLQNSFLGGLRVENA